MFEITSDDIALLNEEDLRALVALLCESELRKGGFSTSSVTSGGNQNAVDGGLDVRVTLPSNSTVSGFVPKPATGFQVKKTSMPPAKIAAEMRPNGTLRPAIRELANKSGAYVIVSSESTSDTALQNRLRAMREAVLDLNNSETLTLDFYDLSRLTTWVREHRELAPWIRERAGKPISGWHSYEAWVCVSEGSDEEYLIDERLRIRTRSESKPALQALEAINSIRNTLRNASGVVRLVGLSGVGKTRLAQALFDHRIGVNSLHSSQAAYTNVADNPDPQPVALVSNLLLQRTPAILVIDNCSADLHRRLSELCRTQGSTVSLLTIEFDIRDDQPEGTDVFELIGASNDLIVKLLGRRFPALSDVDARIIADFSDGNARIAIALASTVPLNGSIANLNDDELFRRLFWQRHNQDEGLFIAAQACSLVYSFQGEDVSENDQTELVRLAATVGKTAQDMYRHIAELSRRDLVQKRGVWRAILPQAIANRLADLALQNIPLATLEKYLMSNEVPERLLKSFSRRLGYLHASSEAIAIVDQWLSPNGRLGNVMALDDSGIAMFNSVAPASPLAALGAIERALLSPDGGNAGGECAQFMGVIRSIAFDASLFDRCVVLIVKIMEESQKPSFNPTDEAFTSLFLIRLSGTQATIEQRLTFIRTLVASPSSTRRRFGLDALNAALEAWHFTSFQTFTFGARSRDYGYWPYTDQDVKHWFGLTLTLVEDLSCSDQPYAKQVRKILADKFRIIWTKAGVHDELDRTCRAIARHQFWPEGWIAVRNTQYFDSAPPDVSVKLSVIEEALRPADIVQKVRAIVLPPYGGLNLDLESNDHLDIVESYERRRALSEELGITVARHPHLLDELLGELVTSEGELFSFGRGLAKEVENPELVWNRLAAALASATESNRRPEVLCGFVNAIRTRDPVLTSSLLEQAIESEALALWYPLLQSRVGIDEAGKNRLMRSLSLGKAPMRIYRCLDTDSLSASDLRQLILAIASKNDGFGVAVELLRMRLHSESKREQGVIPDDLLDLGRTLIGQIDFTNPEFRVDYGLGDISKQCLVGDNDAATVRDLCQKLKRAISEHLANAYHCYDLLLGLLGAQPIATLDGLLADNDPRAGLRILRQVGHPRQNPLEGIPEEMLLAWCDQEPQARYKLISQVVTLSELKNGDKLSHWTPIALRLLEKAPNKPDVVKGFISQVHAMGWIGSQAAFLESAAKLLDELGVHIEAYTDPETHTLIANQTVQLRRMVEQEQGLETARDKERNERFE